MSLKLHPQVPSLSVLPPMTSSSKYVNRSRLVEIQPQAQTSFSYATNSEIVFQINSPSDMVNFLESYLRFKLTCTMENNGVDVISKYLAEGAGHSLFQRIVVETSSGTRIQDIDQYNRLYHIMSSASHSAEHVDYIEAKAGDSVDTESVLDPVENMTWQVQRGTVDYDHTGGDSERLVSGTGTKFEEDFQVGDLVLIEGSGANDLSVYATVAAIGNDTTMTLKAVSGEIDVAATALIYRKRKATSQAGVRKLAANTDNYVICMQPALGCLNIPSFFPLAFIRGGIRIRFMLEQPEFVLAAPVEPEDSVGFGNVNYTISNPVYMTNFVTPTDALMQQYKDLYSGPGLHYGFMNYVFNQDIVDLNGGLNTSNLRINCRSAKHIFAKIQNARARQKIGATADSGKSTYTCDSIAQGLKAGLLEYRFQSGSEVYPSSKPVDLRGISNSEAFAELLRCFSHAGSTIHSKRFRPSQWQERVQSFNPYEATSVADSQRLILSAKLSRDDSFFAGLDLSMNDLQAEFEFDGAYQLTNKDGTGAVSGGSTRYILYWLGHDAYLSISKDGIITGK